MRKNNYLCYHKLLNKISYKGFSRVPVCLHYAFLNYFSTLQLTKYFFVVYAVKIARLIIKYTFCTLWTFCPLYLRHFSLVVSSLSLNIVIKKGGSAFCFWVFCSRGGCGSFFRETFYFLHFIHHGFYLICWLYTLIC